MVTFGTPRFSNSLRGLVSDSSSPPGVREYGDVVTGVVVERKEGLGSSLRRSLLLHHSVPEETSGPDLDLRPTPVSRYQTPLWSLGVQL